jgi:hypothetical protein
MAARWLGPPLPPPSPPDRECGIKRLT